MEISCAFATSSQTPSDIVAAEQLGYQRAWCFDSPGLFADVWMALARAADRTTTIGLGPAVLVPSMRHPMVTAAATAALVEQAPGRVQLAIGAGFSAQLALGQRPLPWSVVRAYARTVRALLAGEDVEWEGAVMRMLHPAGFGAPRPIQVPLLIGADGPKGFAAAAELGDGVFTVMVHADRPPLPRRQLLLQAGTVLRDGEAPDSARVRDAAGHALAVVYHAVFEKGGADAVQGLPGGAQWLAAISEVPERERHLAIHEGHLIALNPLDEQAWAAAGPQALTTFTLTGTAEQLRERLRGLDQAGFSEVVYQPAGADIPGELAAFASAAGLVQHTAAS